MTPGPPRGRSFGWNAGALLVAQVTVPVLNAALIIVMARWMGPDPLGTYSLLVTAFLVLDQVRLLGIQRLVTREIAAHGVAALHNYRGLRALADLGTVAVVVILAFYGARVGAAPAATLAFAAGFIPSAAVLANDALFLAFGRADCTTRVVLVESCVRMVGSLAVLWLRGADLVALGVVFSGGRALAAFLGARYRRQLIGDSVISHDWNAARALVPQVPAFFAVTALPLVLLRADLLVVGAVASAGDVGLYTAASRLVSIMLLVPDSIMTANFVRITRARAAGHAGQVRRDVAIVLVLCVLLFVPLAVAVVLWGDRLTQLVFGAPFAAAGVYMAWLVWSLPLFVASRGIGDTLIAWGQQTRMAWVIVAATLCSIPLYVVLAGRWGAVGAAASHIGSILILLVLSAAAARALFRVASSQPRTQPWIASTAGEVRLEAK